MSDLSFKFLQCLRADLRLLADGTCPISSRLAEWGDRIDFSEQTQSTVLSWDREQGRLIVSPSHPAVAKLLNSPTRRRSDVIFFISTLASLLNREEADITDDDERVFHAKLLRFALENSQGSWSG